MFSSVWIQQQESMHWHIKYNYKINCGYWALGVSMCQYYRTSCKCYCTLKTVPENLLNFIVSVHRVHRNVWGEYYFLYKWGPDTLKAEVTVYINVKNICYFYIHCINEITIIFY